MRHTASKSILLYAIFVLSGSCGLGYQVVWSRLFALGFGHELPAVLATIAAFFGGLSLGAWILDGPISRSDFPGRWYGALELVIGVWGLFSIVIIPRCNDLALKSIGLEASVFQHWTVAFSVPFLVLLPATAAMGATLPAMERFLSTSVAPGRHIGALYAANTLGAVAGTLIATFGLMRWVGFTSTLAIFATLNLVCGIAALAVRPGNKHEAIHSRPVTAGDLSQRRLNAAVFLTGLLGIGYEVAGVRVLAEVLENTIYTFAAVLSVYLLGTAIGASFYQRLGGRVRDQTVLCVLVYAVSTACALGALVLSKAELIYRTSRSAFGDSAMAVFGAEMVVAAALYGLPTILMGATFSHLVQSARRDEGGVGRAVSLNTLGSALAPALFGFFLFPLLGAKWTMVLVSLGYLLLLPEFLSWHGLVMMVPFGLLCLVPSRLQFVEKPPGGELLEYRSGVMDSVAVVKHFDGNRSLIVNNRFTMGGTGAANAARRHAHIPLLLHADPRRALFLGVGTGITFAGAAPHSNVQADGVELVPEVLEVRHYFEPYNALRPGLRLYVADARRFVRVTDSRYDVIIADLFHPARDGAGALYTREHFQAIRSRLSTNGLFCQWLPLYQLDEAMLQVIIRTVLEVFPHTRAFLLRFNVDTPVLGLIAALEPTQYPYDWFERRVRENELRQELKPITLGDSFQLFGSLVAGPKALREFSHGAPLNTDDHPVVIFGAPRFSYQRNETSYGRLFALLDLQAADPTELIRVDENSSSTKFIHELIGFINARDIYLRGLVFESQGRLGEAVDAFVESVRRSSVFSTGYAHCLTLAVQQSKTSPEAARTLLQRLSEAQPDRPVARDLMKKLFEL